MQLAAVLLARVLGFIEVSELNPKGKVFFPDLTAKIIERFKFQGYPQKLEDFDAQKGVNFNSGTWDGVNVDKLTIFWNGILLDTQSSTDDSERILYDSLSWVRDEFGLRYDPSKVKRKRHVSHLAFYSDAPMTGTGGAIQELCQQVSKRVEEIMGKPISYIPTELTVDFERQGTIPFAPFKIQRRVETPFAENKYFSEAPFPTSVHIEILERFEHSLLQKE